MQWLALSSKEKPYTISDKHRSKILAILAESYYKEDEAFHLHENYLYNLSEIEVRSIVDIVN
ncbi:MAG: hypothetical protein U9N32_00245 [Spirochaetota bacterium]|nr:hypothetical protein [Spirochaetota bacterium]